MLWNPFSKEEFKITISSYNNSSSLGLDKLSWSHLKLILQNNECLINIIRIANLCIDLGYWLSHFKKSTTVVIPKPNKTFYDNPKLFRPIILLNTVSKLIKKVIGNRLQFHIVSNSFIYPSQLGGLKFKSITDAGVVLTHIICSGWVKNLSTSILAFDIAQFFPSLNYHFLTFILRKVGFDFHIANFFSNYLIRRKMNYFWNDFTSPSLNVNVGMGQGSALSPILSALYLLSFLYILEKCLKILKIPISILLFVDDGLLLLQSKSFSIFNFCLFCSYNIVTILFSKFRLIVKHSKTEVFYFNRSQGSFNPPPLDLSLIEGPILCSKEL